MRAKAAIITALILSACSAQPPEPVAPAPSATLEPAPQEMSFEILGKQLVEALARGESESVAAHFDAAMQQAMPLDRLATLWPSLEDQAGAFQAIEAVRLEERGELTAAVVTVAFERLKLDLRVVYTPQHRITGLFVQPAKLDHAYRPPSYADPGSFSEQQVTVGDGGRWPLPGTLTLPTGEVPCPAVVLVHGSGPNDRDETLGPNKPFRDLAEGLATRGIGVLRYDKRTRVHGEKMAGTEITLREETIDDALEAVALLRKRREVDGGRIFVVGHSLGGSVVPRIAKRDSEVAGFVIMAGSTTPLEDAVLRQSRYLAELDGALSKDEREALAALEDKVQQVKALKQGDEAKNLLLGVPASYWLDLRDHRPTELIAAEHRPILVLQGGRDYQVTAEDFAGWKKALEGRPNVTFEHFEALNHLFIAGKGKSQPGEYQQPGHVALEVIESIVAHVKAGD